MKKSISYLFLFAFIGHMQSQELYFPPIIGNTWETTSIESVDYCQEKVEILYDFLEDSNTKGFILLKDGRIVLEQYFDNFTQDSLWYWASAGKSLTSFLVGLAQEEGALSIQDKTSDYLGQGWTSATSVQEQNITIKDQLSMTTGLDDTSGNRDCTEPDCLIYKADAGNRWAYHNGPYTLLDAVMESALGLNLNMFLNQKLATKTGIIGAYINLDYNNVFFSKPRSMARFGLLMLNKGNWNGQQIMTDMNYFNDMIQSSQSLNESYGYLWWLNGKSSFMLPTLQSVFTGKLIPNAPDDMYAALGKNGQLLSIVPSENLVWLRMGNQSDVSLVPTIYFNDLWALINNLSCTSSTNNIEPFDMKIGPNPTNDYLQIQAENEIFQITLYNATGQLILHQKVHQKVTNINLSSQAAGIYTLSVEFVNGTIRQEQVVLGD